MLNSPFIVPVVAILAGIGLAALKTWFKHREAMRASDVGGADLRQEIAALKRRVEALEILATDTKEQLKREIDSL